MKDESLQTLFWMLILMSVSLTVVMVMHYLMLFELWMPPYDYVTNIVKWFNNDQYTLRVFYSAFIIAISIVSPNYGVNKNLEDKEKYRIRLFAIILVPAFVLGYLNFIIYSKYIYPFVFILSVFYLHRACNSFRNKLTTGDSIFTKVNKLGENIFSVVFMTEYGGMVLNSLKKSLGIFGAPGSGKTKIIANIIKQVIFKGHTLFVYDYDGDPRTLKEGAEEKPLYLTRTVYSALLEINQNVDADGLVTYYTGEREVIKVLGKKLRGKKIKYKAKPVKFEFIMPLDPFTSTGKVNFFNKKYHSLNPESSLESAVERFLLSAEPNFQKKKDVWANYGIGYVTAIALRLSRIDWKYLTLAHLVSMTLMDYNIVLTWIAMDKTLAKKASDIMSAFNSAGAGGQLAGATSSGQAPLKVFYNKHVFWAFCPRFDEREINLKVSSTENPVALCVGNSQRFESVLSAPLSAILSSVVTELDEVGNRENTTIVDEYYTLSMNADQISKASGVLRKKDAGLIIAGQSIDQGEKVLGKENNNILMKNLPQKMIGYTADTELAKKMIERMPKKEWLNDQNISYSADGKPSYSEKIEKKPQLEPYEITEQNVGHFTGSQIDGDPKFFHCQFDDFDYDIVDKLPIQHEWVNEEVDKEIMEELINERFDLIEGEIEELLQPVIDAANLEKELAETLRNEKREEKELKKKLKEDKKDKDKLDKEERMRRERREKEIRMSKERLDKEERLRKERLGNIELKESSRNEREQLKEEARIEAIKIKEEARINKKRLDLEKELSKEEQLRVKKGKSNNYE